MQKGSQKSRNNKNRRRKSEENCNEIISVRGKKSRCLPSFVAAGRLLTQVLREWHRLQCATTVKRRRKNTLNTFFFALFISILGLPYVMFSIVACDENDDDVNNEHKHKYTWLFSSFPLRRNSNANDVVVLKHGCGCTRASEQIYQFNFHI